MNNGLSVWNFQINDKTINLDKSIDHLLTFLENLNLNFFLDNTKSEYSLVEKILLDVVLFHANRLKIDMNNKHISFWGKSTEYMFDCLHVHIDHCDYERQMYNTQNKKPLFTTLLYFNDNDCPTLLTDVTREMKNNSDFINNKNTKIGFSFPKRFKNITFDSGNYYHGETYLSDYKQTSRKVIVVALWDEINKPYSNPFFPVDLFYHFCFKNYEYAVLDNNTKLYDKNIPLVLFNNADDNIIIIKVNDKKLINYDLFYNILIKKDKKCLYKFKQIFEKFMTLDTFILHF